MGRGQPGIWEEIGAASVLGQTYSGRQVKSLSSSHLVNIIISRMDVDEREFIQWPRVDGGGHLVD